MRPGRPMTIPRHDRRADRRDAGPRAGRIRGLRNPAERNPAERNRVRDIRAARNHAGPARVRVPAAEPTRRVDHAVPPHRSTRVHRPDHPAGIPERRIRGVPDSVRVSAAPRARPPDRPAVHRRRGAPPWCAVHRARAGAGGRAGRYRPAARVRSRRPHARPAPHATRAGHAVPRVRMQDPNRTGQVGSPGLRTASIRHSHRTDPGRRRIRHIRVRVDSPDQRAVRMPRAGTNSAAARTGCSVVRPQVGRSS